VAPWRLGGGNGVVQTTLFPHARRAGNGSLTREPRRMNEWIAFGIVAVICGLLALLANLPAESEPPPGENDS